MKNKFLAYLFIGGTALLVGSPKLMSFLDRWEGTRYVVYADKLAGGLPTVCKGITNYTSPYPVIVGEKWTKAKCDEVEHLVIYETQKKLRRCIKTEIPQSVFDALTSHAHNFGWPRTCASASVAAINEGDIKRGCDLLAYTQNGNPNWSSVGTTFVQGLHNRRKAERKLCLSELH